MNTASVDASRGSTGTSSTARSKTRPSRRLPRTSFPRSTRWMSPLSKLARPVRRSSMKSLPMSWLGSTRSSASWNWHAGSDGYHSLLLMLALDPEASRLLFDKIVEFQKKVISYYYGKLGRYIHLTTSGDDFGTQHGLMISPAMFRETVKPCMADRIAYTARFTDALRYAPHLRRRLRYNSGPDRDRSANPLPDPARGGRNGSREAEGGFRRVASPSTADWTRRMCCPRATPR